MRLLSYLLGAREGAAYKAKALCSAAFVSRRDVDGRAEDVSAEGYWPMRIFPASIDRAAGAVSCWGRRAVFRPGYGATLASGPLAPLPEPPRPRRSEPWPLGEGTDALRRAVAGAFVEPSSGPRRRTRAVVVIHDGRLAAEGYAPGFSAETPLPGWSMTKSVFGLLAGIAGLAPGDSGLLPEWRGDERARITLEDLLRMRSGLRFGEDYSNPRSDVVRMLFREPDAGRYAASRLLEAEPGSAWKYSSGTTNILSLLLRRRLGEPAYWAFPREALFDPLGMESAVLEPDASGTYVGSSFMLATARDWARLGWLAAQNGVWNGRRVLPEGWTEFCRRPTPQAPEGKYGAHWWLKLGPELGGESPEAARLPADAFYALGHEGQTIAVVPSRRAVVVRLGLSVRIDAWNQAAFLERVLAALP